MADKAEQIKNQGNAAFQRKNYQEAINLYTQAIKLRKEAAFYQNRAAAYYQLGKYDSCVADAEEALKIDPDYVKAHQKRIEGLFKQNKLSQALPLAEQLFLRDQTSRTRELVTEVRRANKLINSETESLQLSVQNGIIKTLKLIVRVIGYLSSASYPVLSTQKRQENMAEADKYELAKCEIIQTLSNFRDEMADCGLKSIPDDFKFLTKNLPNYRIEPATQATYFLLMHIFRETAEAFGHFGLEGFPGDETEMADPNYFLNRANAVISQISNKVQKLSLQCSWYLLSRQLDQAKQGFKNLAQADNQFQSFIQAFQTYEQHKEAGTNLYKASKPGADAEFKAATLSLLNYETLPNADPASLPVIPALLHLSARFLAAQSLSNEGMSYSKRGDSGKALALLAAAVFVDGKYVNAHARAGQLFKEKQMYGEARIEYSAAQALNPPTSMEAHIKECQQQEQRFKRKDYYALLGVDRSVDPTSKEYQKKYKLMCVKWHPDSHQRGTAKRRFAEQKFRQIQEANNVLTDKNKKAIYDQGGDPNDSSSGGFPSGMDMSQFMQMGGGGGRQVFIPMDASEGFGGFGGFGIDISQIFSMMGGGGGPRGGAGRGARASRGGRGGDAFGFNFFD